jgi:hypothetical protein
LIAPFLSSLLTGPSQATSTVAPFPKGERPARGDCLDFYVEERNCGRAIRFEDIKRIEVFP